MKKLILMTAALLMAGSTAYASKARMEALGQNTDGSHIISDDRNIFLNPAHLHNMTDRFFFEWGAAGSGTKVDAVGNPKAEGGYFRKNTNSGWGLYLGNEDEDIITLRNSSSTSFLKPDNTVDFFYGQTAGNIKWGANLSYSNSSAEAAFAQKESLMSLRGGAIIGNLYEVYAHANLIDTADGAATDADDKYVGSGSVTVGGVHNLKDSKIYIQIANGNAKYTPSGGTEVDVKGSTMTVGWGKMYKMDNGTAFIKVAYESVTTEIGTTKIEMTTLPITLGMEKKVKDWLALRGSLKQAALINTLKTDTGAATTSGSNADTTAASAGMTIYMDKFEIDGNFTTTAGTLNAGNIMSRVGMKYLF